MTDPAEATIAGESLILGLGGRCDWIANEPRPLLVVRWVGSWLDRQLGEAIIRLARGISKSNKLFPNARWPLVRCVPIECLASVLEAGCDVHPTDAVIWVDHSPGKALEYGGEAKAMMLFDSESLMPTWQEVDSGVAAGDLEILRQTYSTLIPSVDGTKLWLTRLPLGDKRAAEQYEVNHARWIPGDAFVALLGIIVFGRDQRVLESVQSTIRACRNRQWHMR